MLNENKEYMRILLGIRIIMIVTVFSGIVVVSATEIPEVEWIKLVDVAGIQDLPSSVQQTSDGGYVVAGVAKIDWYTNFEGYVIKTDANGNLEWKTIFGGPKRDAASSVQQTSDGGYVVAGYYSIDSPSNLPDAVNAYLVKLDANGNIEWEKFIKHHQIYYYKRTLISAWEVPDGYLAVGFECIPTPNCNLWIIRTDANGNLTWEKKTQISTTSITSIQRTDDGGFILAGVIDSNHERGYLAKLDADGNLKWEKRFESGAQRYWYDTLTYVQQTNDGGYIAVGYAFHVAEFDVWLIKTDANGNLEWQKLINRPHSSGSDKGFSVVQTHDGGYLVAGASQYYWPFENYDVWLIKTDANGNLEWQNRIESKQNEYYHEIGKIIKQTKDGGYIIAGVDSPDILLIKLAPTNRPPVALTDPYVANEGETIIFDASASYDSDGDPLQYRWDFDGDGVWDTEWMNEPTTEYTFMDDFNGSIILEVTDGELTNTTTASIVILNVPPSVNAGSDIEVTAGDSVSFTGSFTDPGNDTHTIEWDFADGGNICGTLTPTHIFYDKGVYNVTLKVIDDDGGVGSDVVTVVVNPIEANITILQKVLSQKSKGNLIAKIRLPEPYNISNIELSSVKCEGSPAVKGIIIGDMLMAIFDRGGVTENLPVGEYAQITIEGKVYHNGGYADFEGKDMVRVVGAGEVLLKVKV
jgi:PKD repeat protein